MIIERGSLTRVRNPVKYIGNKSNLKERDMKGRKASHSYFKKHSVCFFPDESYVFGS